MALITYIHSSYSIRDNQGNSVGICAWGLRLLQIRRVTGSIEGPGATRVEGNGTIDAAFECKAIVRMRVIRAWARGECQLGSRQQAVGIMAVERHWMPG